MKNKLRIVLINPPSNCVEDDRKEPPLGLLYIAGSLKANGFEDISLFDMTGCRTEKEISLRLNCIPEADIFGVSCYSTNFQYARQTILNIKKRDSHAYVVTGGP
ncbi:cobalamin-dependent protein, partial [bacterium]|nr:cobalamin-dependent protein [bacterium]